MPRKISSIAPDWWDYTTLDDAILQAAATLTPEKIAGLGRPGFKIVLYDTLEEFYLAEALEYITAWRQSTPDNPVGICGPIGPTEQLPLVARLVNDLNLSLKSAHFWGMDEWMCGASEAPLRHPLSFEPDEFPQADFGSFFVERADLGEIDEPAAARAKKLEDSFL